MVDNDDNSGPLEEDEQPHSTIDSFEDKPEVERLDDIRAVVRTGEKSSDSETSSSESHPKNSVTIDVTLRTEDGREHSQTLVENTPEEALSTFLSWYAALASDKQMKELVINAADLN